MTSRCRDYRDGFNQGFSILFEMLLSISCLCHWWLHKTCIYFSLWKGLTFYIKVSIKPLDEISLSASVLIYHLETLKDQTYIRSSWENFFLPLRQLRNTEIAQPPSAPCKNYCKGSTKGSKRIFGEHATEPFLIVEWFTGI